MYALHYAACDHMGLFANLKIAADLIPVYVSDWHSSDYVNSPDKVCVENSNEFLSYLNGEHNISWNYWAWGGKTGIWKECGAGFKKDNLTNTGSFILTETEELDFKDDTPTIVKNVEDNDYVKVAPNPADDAFTVTFKGKANVSIYGAVGQKVFEEDGINSLYVNDKFATGVYSIVVKGEDYVGNVKLIVR
jgi:hypothetical protein